MIKLEEAIKKYINDLPFGNAFDDCDIKKAIEFGAQWQQANGWISVERNSDGVASKDCLEEMLSSLPTP